MRKAEPCKSPPNMRSCIFMGFPAGLKSFLSSARRPRGYKNPFCRTEQMIGQIWRLLNILETWPPARQLLRQDALCISSDFRWALEPRWR